MVKVRCPIYEPRGAAGPQPHPSRSHIRGPRSHLLLFQVNRVLFLPQTNKPSLKRGPLPRRNSPRLGHNRPYATRSDEATPKLRYFWLLSILSKRVHHRQQRVHQVHRRRGCSQFGSRTTSSVECSVSCSKSSPRVPCSSGVTSL